MQQPLGNKHLIKSEPQHSISPNIFSDYESYKTFASVNTDEGHTERELALSHKHSISGYCVACQTETKFNISYKHSITIDNVVQPNWRETLSCTCCNLVNRTRAVVHVLHEEQMLLNNPNLYITEQFTPLYKYLKRSNPDIVGSEYLGLSLPTGVKYFWLRNEDLTNLSFDKESFDALITLDVLEHIPNYMKALTECYRVLRTGAKLFISVPFDLGSKSTLVRAVLNDDGSISHNEHPEYHGIPNSFRKALCYYHFGWELLDDLKSIGFSKSRLITIRSRYFGYLGEPQIIIQATK